MNNLSQEERERLFQDNIKLAGFYVKQRMISGTKMDKDELMQLAMIALWEACLEFDPTIGAKFSVFAMNKMRWDYRNADIVQHRLETKEGASINANVKFDSGEADEEYEDHIPYGDAEEEAIERISQREIEEFRNSLKQGRDKLIFDLRMSGYDMVEIGKKIGISKQRVFQRLQEIRKQWERKQGGL